MKRICILSLTVAALVVYTAARADDAQTLAKIDEQLEKLQSYEYGQDGNPLRDLERTIFQLPTDSPLRPVIEQKLIDSLDDSNDIGRGVICRQLRAVGTDKCIPAITPLLSDEKLAHFARYALQGIGSPAALKAMHEAVGDASGALQAGLLNSLSDRRYEPMRENCIELLGSDDPTVSAAAVRALGRLGGDASVAALTKAKANATGPLARDIDLALLNCADMLLQEGESGPAAEIYAALYQPDGPFRLAGLRGLVIAQPDKAADLLVDAIRQGESQLAKSAIKLTDRASDPKATAKFVELLQDLESERRILLLKSLGSRGDQAAAPAIAEAAGSEDAAVRMAAIEALGGLSGPVALDALLKAAVSSDNSSQRVARASLARLEAADSQLAAIARNSDDSIAVEAIRALAARKSPGMNELMLQLAEGENAIKRAAAIEAIGTLAGPAEVDSIVDLAIRLKTQDDLPAIEQSLGRVLLRIQNPTERAAPLLAALPDASDDVRPVLIRQLGKSGTPDALAAVRKALQSSETAESDAAVVALADWPNPTASDDLIGQIQSARTPELKTIAMNGYLRIATASDDPAAMFLDALKKVDNVGDKKLVLNEIGLNCESLEALNATCSLLDDTQLQAVAAIATIRIAYKLRDSHKDDARRILESVLAKVDHPDVQKRAQEVLNDIDKYQDHIMQWIAVGPFIDDKIANGEQSYKTVFEPEKPDTSDLQWELLTQGRSNWSFNLEATYGSIDHCAAYAKTMVWSPLEQDVQIEGGCDDALRIWVNGELIYDKFTIGGATPRTMIAPATLRQGWNELKLKAVDHEGGWEFGCRVRKPNGAKLDGLKYEAR